MLKTFLLISVLFSLVVTFKPATSTVAYAECNCSNLEVLQIELRNAQKLQKAFQSKIPELRGMSDETSMMEFKRFADRDARKGLEPLPNNKAAKEFDYIARGDNLYDPTKPPASETNENMCRLSDGAKVALDGVVSEAACDGIGNAIKAHEAVHHNSCLRRGYVNFFKMNGAARAQEEADAYGAQIAALKAEIAQVLERAQVTVITDLKTRTTVPANPLYQTIGVDNHAEIPATRVSGSTDRFVFEGQGQQTNNATVDGNCKMTSGVPFNLPAKVTITTDGLIAEINYEVMGTHPSIGMKCTIPGVGTGTGMSIPVQLNAGKVPLTKLPLKDGATEVMDMAQSEAAKILAGGGVTLTGTATVTIKCK